MPNILVSKNRLQEYIKETLPDDAALAEALTLHIFEVEGIEKNGNDSGFDIKVLPDRAGYGFSHRYVAQEIAAILGSTYAPPVFEKIKGTDATIKMTIEDLNVNPLHLYRKISGIKNGESPAWLKDMLETLGQRSINLVVDLTNFVMFDTGQPMHAFDADKVDGDLVVKYAKEGDEITLLDGKVIKLDSSIMVFADNTGLLDIAGIKGGKKAEVTKETENIVLIAGHFNPTYIRKTAQKIGIKNDSSKRFENAVTIERPQLAMEEFSQLLKTKCEQRENELLFEEIDQAGKDTYVLKTLVVDPSYVNERIGVEVTPSEMLEILKRLDFQPKEEGSKIHITIPIYRADINIQEDIAEEIARLYGFEKIEGVVPEHQEGRDILPSFEYANRIRLALVEIEFSEVYTYTLRDRGDFELANPLNVERSHLRNSIGEGFPKVLEMNLRNLDLLGLKAIRVFEIGHVFKNKKEGVSLAIGITAPAGKGRDTVIKQGQDGALSAIAQIFKIAASEIPKIEIENGVIEINLGSLIENTEVPTDEVSFSEIAAAPNTIYKKFSPYPYITRDIAVFIPGPKGKADELRTLIESLDSPLAVKIYQFDEFEKKNSESGEVEKTSYAFRIIFQSNERTLTDVEVEEVMQKLNAKIAEKEGWEIR